INVGDLGAGRLDVINGGQVQVSNWALSLGNAAGGSGGTLTVAGPGSLVNLTSSTFVVGQLADGAASVLAGGQVKPDFPIVVGEFGNGSLRIDGVSGTFR